MSDFEQFPGRQWWDRFELWGQWFSKHIWNRYEEITFSYMVTMERLSYQEALSRLKEKSRQALYGEKWGKHWEYGWFEANWTVPEELHGKRLVLLPAVGEEMLVWVNGQERGAVDKKHAYITLTREAEAGKTYHIVMECYAGHGPRMEGGCFCTKGESPFCMQDNVQQQIGNSCVAVWQEEIFQVGMDYLTLFSLLKKLPRRSLRVSKVIEGMKRFTQRADVEAEWDKLPQILQEADKELKPLLDCVNGSTAPCFSIFGQSHLDLAWLWTLEETKRKAARTYGNQLTLMEEYPEYRFLLCEPPILEYLKEYYPDVWKRVKQKVKEGQIYADGAVYVESDMNMPCGESLVRQFLYGKEWFEKELSTDSTVAWMPDTFGFPASLPQIMKKARVDYFTTQKLTRQDPECEPFPYNHFWWQGIDGSRVLSHVYKENNAVPSPEKMIERWEKDRIQDEGIENMLFPFGYGDGGGGATREELEYVRRLGNLEGAPKTVYESPAAFFKKLEKKGTENIFSGELYLAWHRGTYTSQAKTKLGVRKAECLLKEAEYWYTLFHVIKGNESGLSVSREEMTSLWKRLLLQEFHDILPGTGIARVHEETEKELSKIAVRAEEIIRECLEYLNDEKKQSTEKDQINNGILIKEKDWNAEKRYVLESKDLYIELDCQGRIRIMQTKSRTFTQKNAFMNEFRLYRNVNPYYDAWEIGRMYEQEEEPINQEDWGLEASVYEGRKAWLLKGKIGDSPFSEYITLSEDGRQIEFYMEINWQECHRMLKVDFPGNLCSNQIIGEIAFGVCSQPVTSSWKWEKDRYEVCRHRFCCLENGREGIAVMNDSKYGWSGKEDRISLTLLRASVMPDAYADRGTQHFSYACRPYEGTFGENQIAKQAIDFDRHSHIAPDIIKSECKAAEKYALYFLAGDSEEEPCHIITEAVKLAEKADNKFVLRLYESTGVPQTVWLSFPFEVVQVEETNLLEKEGILHNAEENRYRLEFGAFEIKTIMVQRKQEKE